MDEKTKLVSIEMALWGYLHAIADMTKDTGITSIHLGIINGVESGRTDVDASCWSNGERVINLHGHREA